MRFGGGGVRVGRQGFPVLEMYKYVYWVEGKEGCSLQGVSRLSLTGLRLRLLGFDGVAGGCDLPVYIHVRHELLLKHANRRGETMPGRR